MPNTPQDHWDYTIKEWGSEPFISIVNKLPELKNIWDVGANVGGFSYVMKKKYPKAKITCFEPVEINHKALVENMPDVVALKKGIYYGKTESKVLWRGENIGAFFVEHINSGEPRIENGETMELITLESLNSMPDLIKLDVEGAEENIIEHSTVIKNIPHIIVEWHPDTPPLPFFEKHLPNHKVNVNLQDKQFLLCLR